MRTNDLILLAVGLLLLMRSRVNGSTVTSTAPPLGTFGDVTTSGQWIGVPSGDWFRANPLIIN